MENTAIALLNLAVLGTFMLFGMRELSRRSLAAVKIRSEEQDR